MKVIFLSTPEFGIPSLEALLKSHHKVIAIITQPDRPQDRGKKSKFSPVKDFALKHDIPVYQFEKISREGVDTIKELNPDIMVTASYGQILSQQIIDIPKYGIINIHGSILPKYRGASPVQAAILNGETETGVTIMKTEAGLDTGDIILIKKTKILENETAGELMERLSYIGAEALLEVLEMFENESVPYTAQSHIDATVTRMISKDQGIIFWDKSAEQIKDQIHAYNPSPIAFTFLNGDRVKIYTARCLDDIESSEEPGTVIDPTSSKNGLFVKCGFKCIEIRTLQFPGGKIITGQEAVGGRKIKIGDKFSSSFEGDANPVILS